MEYEEKAAQSKRNWVFDSYRESQERFEGLQEEIQNSIDHKMAQLSQAISSPPQDFGQQTYLSAQK